MSIGEHISCYFNLTLTNMRSSTDMHTVSFYLYRSNLPTIEQNKAIVLFELKCVGMRCDLAIIIQILKPNLSLTKIKPQNTCMTFEAKS